MSTEISTTTKPTSMVEAFSDLLPGSDLSAIIEANLEGESISEMDLTRVKTPSGGSTTWEIDNQGNTEATQEIVGVIVAMGRRGLLWPYDEIGTDPPVLSSPDLVIGYRTSDKLGNVKKEDLEKFRIGDRKYDWAAISESKEFGNGSGKNGIGKRVKESRLIAIRRPGEIWPLLISVGPGSMASFMPFIRKLSVPHYRAVVGLRLQKAVSKGKVTYSEIVPRFIEALPPEHGKEALTKYTIPLKKMFSAAPYGFSSSDQGNEGGDSDAGNDGGDTAEA